MVAAAEDPAAEVEVEWVVRVTGALHPAGEVAVGKPWLLLNKDGVGSAVEA